MNAHLWAFDPTQTYWISRKPCKSIYETLSYSGGTDWSNP